MCLTCGLVSCPSHMQQHCNLSSPASSGSCHPISMCLRTYSVYCFVCSCSLTIHSASFSIAKKHIVALRMAARTRDKLVMTPGRLVRSVTSGLIGLKNGGNTCFANCVVQVSNPPLISVFMSCSHHMSSSQSLANIPLFPFTLLRQQVNQTLSSHTNQSPISSNHRISTCYLMACVDSMRLHPPSYPAPAMLLIYTPPLRCLSPTSFPKQLPLLKVTIPRRMEQCWRQKC
jgi:hypothetical protein